MVDKKKSAQQTLDFTHNGLDKIKGAPRPKAWQQGAPAGQAKSYYKRSGSDNVSQALHRRELDARSPKGKGGSSSAGSHPSGGQSGKPAKTQQPQTDTAAAIQTHEDRQQAKAVKDSNKAMYAMQATDMAAQALPYAMQGGSGGYGAQGGYGGGYQDPSMQAGGYGPDPYAAQGGYPDPSAGYGAAPSAPSGGGTTNGQRKTDSSTQQVSSDTNRDKTMAFRRWIVKRAEPAPPAPAPAPPAPPAAAPKPPVEAPKPPAEAPKPSAAPSAAPSKPVPSHSTSSKAASHTSHSSGSPAGTPTNAANKFPIMVPAATSTSPKQQDKSKTSSASGPKETGSGNSYSSTESETKIVDKSKNIDKSDHRDYSTHDSSDRSQRQSTNVNAGGDVVGDGNGAQANCPQTQVVSKVASQRFAKLTRHALPLAQNPNDFCADYPEVCADTLKSKKQKKQGGKNGQQKRRQVVLGNLDARADSLCQCYCGDTNYVFYDSDGKRDSISSPYKRRSLIAVQPNDRRAVFERRAFVVPKGCSVVRKAGRSVYGGKLCPIAGKKAVHK